MSHPERPLGDATDAFSGGAEPKLRARIDWSGVMEETVNLKALEHAERFERLLPLDIPLPWAGADPDMEVSFEWSEMEDATMTISFSPEGRIAWASLVGGVTDCGTAPFRERIPPHVLAEIRRVVQAEAAAGTPPDTERQ